MVRYTGYTDLFLKAVSWVLSEEMMMGMIVAPGFFSSGTFCDATLAAAKKLPS